MTATLLATIALQTTVNVSPVLATQPVGHDADDPAIWVNRRNPSQSLILGTDKIEGKEGALYVFGLDGNIRQRIGGLDRPNNVDVRDDLAVVTERKARRLRVFRIANGRLTDVTGDTPVFSGETGEWAEPMGIALYRPPNGVLTAIVSPKAAPRDGYLGQYELRRRPDGRYDTFPVRRFGRFSGLKEIESILADPLGFVYYSDETAGTRKYYANPDGPKQELAFFNRQGFIGDHEGIALWEGPKESGYLVFTDQRERNSIFHVYDRRTNRPLGRFRGGADETDGIEVTSANLGPRFPRGIMVAMNSMSRNFLIWDWRDIEKKLRLP